MSESQTNAGLKCIVVTPEETVVDTSASYVVAPLFDGEIGISPKHSPMIGRLGFGEMRIRSSAGGAEVTKSYYVDGGFVQVADNVVSVMTNRAKPIEELDADEAAAQLEKALAAPPAGGESLAHRQRAIDQARGMLRCATKG